MLTVQDIYRKLDAIAPFATAESWDNSGILVGSGEDEVTGVVTTLDVTEEALLAALENGCDLIVSHHPVIFHPLKRVERTSLVYRLIQAGISVISAHTNLDSAKEGINTKLAKLLGLTGCALLAPTITQCAVKVAVFIPQSHVDVVRSAMTAAGAGQIGAYDCCTFETAGEGRFRPLAGSAPFLGKQGEVEVVREVRLEAICQREHLPQVLSAMKAAHPYEEVAYDVFEDEGYTKQVGFGCMGFLPEMMDSMAFARQVKEVLGAGGIRVVDGGQPVQCVALCSGAGGSFLEAAIARGADAYICGDLKHSDLILARDRGLTLIDAGHFATENIIVPWLSQWLGEAFEGLPIITNMDSDPAQYL